MRRRSPSRERGGLRLDVPDALIRDADVGQDDGEDLLVHHATLEQLDRRQPESLLLHLRRVGGEAPGHHAAGVRPVSGVGEPREKLAPVEVGLHEAHVHQVGAAQVGVVDDVEIARREVAGALDHRLGAELHGADEDRQAELALRDELSGGGVVDAVGAVQRLRDHRAERRAHEGQVHLVAHLLQAVLDDREGDRIEAGGGWGGAAIHGTGPASPMRVPCGSTSVRPCRRSNPGERVRDRAVDTGCVPQFIACHECADRAHVAVGCCALAGGPRYGRTPAAPSAPGGWFQRSVHRQRM